MTELSFSLDQRPILVNHARRLHWAQQAKITREWRSAFFYLGRNGKQNVDAADVEVVLERKNRRNLPDAAASEFCAKAALDGLVDAGVLPGDGPDHVRSITHRVAVTGRDALTIRLIA